MEALYVDGIDDILATGADPSVYADESFEHDRTDSAVVRASVLGEELDAGECELLAAVMEVCELSPGERLVAEGDVDNRLVLVADGKVAVLASVDGHETGVYTMTRGECAGTRAFVDGTPRKATLQAVDSATVYTLKPEALESLIGLEPTMAYRVMRGLFKATHSNLMRVNQERQQLTNYITKTCGRY
jgi:CRP-like cAMP-binding protein